MKTQMNINEYRDLLAAALLWLMIDKEFHQF